MVETARIKRAEIWEIINTGRLFLRALERFAIENFPGDDDEKESSNTKGSAANIYVSNQRRQQRSDGLSYTVRSNPSPAAATATKKRPAPDFEGGEDERASSPTKRQKSDKGPYRKGVIMYDVKTDEVKGHFDSAASAARSLMSTNPEKSFKTIESGISAVLTGKQKSVVGYKFRHVGTDSKPIPVPTVTKSKQTLIKQQTWHSGPVEQYCAETGQLQHRFESASKAAENFVENNPECKLVTVSKGISRVLRGERASYFNLVFRYEKDKSPLPSFPAVTKRPSKQSGNSTQNEGSTQQQDDEQATTAEKHSTSSDTLFKNTAEEVNGRDVTQMNDAAIAHPDTDNTASGSSKTLDETTDVIKQQIASENLVKTSSTGDGGDNDEPDEANGGGNNASNPDDSGAPVASANTPSSDSAAATSSPVPRPYPEIEDMSSKKQTELGGDLDDGGGGKSKSSAGFATI